MIEQHINTKERFYSNDGNCEGMIKLDKKKFKVHDRVWHKVMGHGTVSTETYNTIYFTTWTCVKYDDYLGQKHSLCGETEELTLVNN